MAFLRRRRRDREHKSRAGTGEERRTAEHKRRKASVLLATLVRGDTHSENGNHAVERFTAYDAAVGIKR
jgi:hypothetical protein